MADQGDFYISAKVAVVGSLLSVVLSLLYLPNQSAKEETSEREQDSTLTRKKRSFVEELRHSGELALRSNLWPLLMVKVLGGVTSSMHSTALPLVLTEQLKFDPSQLGLSMSASMVAVAVFGAVGMAPLTNLMGSSGMAHLGLVSRAILGGIMALLVASTTNTYSSWLFYQVLMVSVLHGLASHALATGLTTQTTGLVDKQEQGALLGLEHGLFSMARIAGPPMGTALLGWGSGLWSVETACGVVDILLVVSLIATMSQTITTSKRKST